MPQPPAAAVIAYVHYHCGGNPITAIRAIAAHYQVDMAVLVRETAP